MKYLHSQHFITSDHPTPKKKQEKISNLSSYLSSNLLSKKFLLYLDRFARDSTRSSLRIIVLIIFELSLIRSSSFVFLLLLSFMFWISFSCFISPSFLFFSIDSLLLFSLSISLSSCTGLRRVLSISSPSYLLNGPRKSNSKSLSLFFPIVGGLLFRPRF